jgi:hypothetical protein
LTQVYIIGISGNVGIRGFEFPAYEISIVPGQTPNVLGEGQSWSEVDSSGGRVFLFQLSTHG